MISKTQFMNGLLGKPVVDAMVKTLFNQSDSFPEVYQAYLDAIEKMRSVLGPDAKHEIQKYITAVDQMCASNFYYRGMQGLKMNYDHFLNPMTPNCTWKEVDYDDYLRPHMAESLPLYESAYRFKRKFETQLPEELKEAEEAVCSYETSMECAGNKLAHYYGYLVGNDLLRHCVPGYQPDVALDFTYARLLENYFGKPVRDDEWEGVYRLSDWVTANIELSDPQSDAVLQEEILMRK